MTAGETDGPDARWPVLLALLLGYLIGGALSFGVRFLDLLAAVGDPMARRTLVLFGMGILGAAVHASAEWSPGSSGAGRGPGPAPESPVASAVAHLAVLAAGGVAGVVVYLAVKAGIALSLVGEVTPQIRFSVAVVLAFSGGFGPILLRRNLRRRS